MRFEGKIAVVTGANSGIGRATALSLIEGGAQVLAVDLTHDDPWPDHARSAARTVECDVAGDQAAGEIDAILRADYGRIDILANVAGILHLAPFLEVTRVDWRRVLDVNLMAPFFLSQIAARLMVEQRVAGRIVNVSSVHAVVSEPNAAPYTASKGGLEAMTRTLATELAPHRITVNCVRPGATRTRMSDPIYTTEVVAALIDRVPLGMIAEPTWVASAICFLASDAACYTTGACLDVDGGYAMDGSLPGMRYT